ncbi:hypothetical protein [Streptomyces sp. cmx-4-9]|uniref:hypothetical protein n=1 Tax=Streptomyces sp. cmx-4-9 TaxID=2790941 RepID=UPI00397EE5C3
MSIHDDRDDSARRPDLTTEDLAHPGASEERSAAVYPGEATRDTDAYGDGDRTGTAAAGGTDTDAYGDADRNGGAPEAQTPAARPDSDDAEPLLGTGEAEEYRKKWSEIQGRFVDDPKDAVKSADSLVADLMQTLASTFSTRKQGLEGQWDRGEQVPTEDLRLALQQYRSFFNRLLKT